MNKKAKKVSGERVLEGKLLTVEVDQVIEPGAVEPARREVVRHRGAAAVRQYRYAPDAYFWEVPAGVIESHESPEVCAARELAEETGCRQGSLSLLVSLHCSPGFSDEVVHLYRADRVKRGDADPEPSERLEVREFVILDALNMIDAGAITDSKTVAAIMLVARDICPVASSEPAV